MELKVFFRKYPRAALGFSGGVDSAYLLYAGKKYGADIRPYFIKTAFQPEFELRDAMRLAKELDVELTVIRHDILAEDRVAENPADRCYYCKSALFHALKQQAVEDGYNVLLDGTNASDEASDRPGMKAIRELEVLSPAAGMRTHERRDPPPFQRGRTVYLGEAFLRLPRYQSTGRESSDSGDPRKDREGRRRSHSHGIL